MLKHIRWKEVENEQLNPLLARQMLSSEKVTLARLVLRKGSIVPEHSHHNEQLSYVLEGALKFFIDGKEVIVRSGEVLCIPPHMPHKVESLEDSLTLDIFDPVREDWINKTDNYLRQEAKK